MKKYIFFVAFLFFWFISNSQPVVPRSNGSVTIEDYRGMWLYNMFAPRYVDTTAANVQKGIDSCGAQIYTYDVDGYWYRACFPVKHWVQVGANITASNGLTKSGSNVVLGGTLANATTIDGSLYSLKLFRNSSTTRPGGQLFWDQVTDTITNGSGLILGLGIYGNKRSLFPNSIRSDYMGGYLFNSNYEAKDSVYIYSVGGDFGWNTSSNLTLTKYPSFTGRTIIQGGTVDFDAVPNNFSQIIVSGSTSPTNNIHANGWWSINTAFVNMTSANDTLDRLVSYMSNGFNSGRIRKHYLLYGRDLGRTDSSFGVFLPSSTMRNVFSGPTSFGDSTNTGPTNSVEVKGHIKMVDGAQQNGYVLTSDANGVGSWAAASGGSGSIINVGSGFRLYVPASSGIKTLFNGYAISLDSSSNTNGLTFKADTLSLVSKQSRDKLRDSLGALINLKVNISDTSGMLTNYVRTNRSIIAGYGLTGTSNLSSNVTLVADSSSLQPKLTFSTSLVKNNNTVTLVNDANTDSTYYGMLGTKGYKPSAVIPTAGKSPGMVPVWQGGSLFDLQTISTGLTIGTTAITSGTAQSVLFESSTNKLSETTGFTFDGTNVLAIPTSGQYQINTTPVAYLPNQATFLNTIYYGVKPASLTHTSGIDAEFDFFAGIGAGANCITCAVNTGVGSRALAGLTSGLRNTALGESAASGTTTANDNTAIGNNTMSSNVSGAFNATLGSTAMKTSTSSDGTALGFAAGFSQTSGADNTNTGFQSGYFNQTGSKNTHTGSGAGTGPSANSNSNNTSFGYFANHGLTSGNGNIAIGDSANYNITSTIRSITIGTALTDNGNNSLNLGAAIFGTGMTGTGVSPAGSIGIVTAAPNSTLHDNGSFAAAYVAKTGTYTATISDYTIECTSGTFTVTLPTAIGITGRIYNIVNSGAGTITVGTTSSQTFANVVATPTTLSIATVGNRMVQSNGANWLLLTSL